MPINVAQEPCPYYDFAFNLHICKRKTGLGPTQLSNLIAIVAANKAYDGEWVKAISVSKFLGLNSYPSLYTLERKGLIEFKQVQIGGHSPRTGVWGRVAFVRLTQAGRAKVKELLND